MLNSTPTVLLFSDGVAFSNAHFGPGVGDVLLNNVQCLGGETSLLDCAHNAAAPCSTGHYEDAGLRCYGEPWHMAGYMPHL